MTISNIPFVERNNTIEEQSGDDNKSVSPFPKDIVQLFLLELKRKDVYSASLVCKDWYSCSQDSRFLQVYTAGIPELISIKRKLNKDFGVWHTNNQSIIGELKRKKKRNLNIEQRSL